MDRLSGAAVQAFPLLRRDIRQHPELALNERPTTALVAAPTQPAQAPPWPSLPTGSLTSGGRTQAPVKPADTGTMSFLHRATPLLLAGLGLMLSSAAALAQSGAGLNGASASATVHIRVVVPPVVRVLQDVHPRALEPTADPTVTAEQTLVVSTNIRHGFCLDLRHNGPPGTPWQLRSVGGDAVAISPQGDGYRLCGDRPGLHTLVLQHEFQPVGTDAPDTALPWPVRTELASI